MFDPDARQFSRADLCELAGYEVETVKALRKQGDWPFSGEDLGAGQWRRYSAIEIVVAAAMRHCADPRGYGLSWKLARMVTTSGGHDAALCALKDKYSQLSPKEACDALGAPWADRGIDLWCGYARLSTAARPGVDVGGAMLPAGTLKGIQRTINDHDFRNRDASRGFGNKISQVFLCNISQIVREIDARAKALRVNFPIAAE